MKQLKDNESGYMKSAVSNVDGFNNVDFLLVHGTEDGKYKNARYKNNKYTFFFFFII